GAHRAVAFPDPPLRRRRRLAPRQPSGPQRPFRPAYPGAAARALLVTVRIDLAAQADFEGFRHASRRLALAGVEPADVVWRLPGDAYGLHANGLPEPMSARDASRLGVPARFVVLCRLAV